MNVDASAALRLLPRHSAYTCRTTIERVRECNAHARLFLMAGIHSQVREGKARLQQEHRWPLMRSSTIDQLQGVWCATCSNTEFPFYTCKSTFSLSFLLTFVGAFRRN